MKKILLVLLLFFTNICYADDWLEILEKKYINIPNISTYKKQYVSFWIKAYRKDGEELALIGNNFEYSIDKFTIDCKNKKSSVDSITIYDKQGKVLFFDELVKHDWHEIAPDTYADAYYRLFCLIPFSKNPFLNKSKH